MSYRDLMDTACLAVLNGAKFHIDFETRSMKLDGKWIVKDGVSTIEQKGRYVKANFLYHVEDFYKEYKNSIPSERSESKGRKYFRALPERLLEDEDMMYGRYRDFAQVQLESYILCCLLEGAEWDEEWGKWFWQCPSEPDLVLLRKWFDK